MDPLATGQVIDGSYRIDELLSESPRALIYAVTHTRFSDAPLVLKVVPLERAGDFERDTSALATLTTPSVARVCDRGTLADGRPYRVVERLSGKTLANALATSAFSDDRVMEMLVDLAAAVFEARANGIGPCDLSVENLMFATEGSRRLCMHRVLAPDARVPDPEADQSALVALRGALERGRDTAMTMSWKPPSSLEELRRASEAVGGPASPPELEVGSSFPGGWRILKTLSESLKATVYSVVGASDAPGILKIAGPQADHAHFIASADALAKVKSPYVVRVFDRGHHGGAPFYVMRLLSGPTLTARVQRDGKLTIEAALIAVDDMLQGAEALAAAGSGPADLSLAHCIEITEERNKQRVVLTHPTTPRAGKFLFYAGGVVETAAMDAWSAAVALYELLAGRSPFPVSRRSMMQVWLGRPVPLAERRRDVPPDISLTISSLVSRGVTMSRAEMRAQLAEWRQGLATQHEAPDRMSVEPPLARPAPVRATDVSPQPQYPAPVIKAAPIVAISHMPQPPVAGAASPSPPLDWRFETLPSRCPLAPLTAAAIRADGSEIVAVSADAVARYKRGKWSIDPARDLIGGVRRIVPIGPDNDYLAISTDKRIYRLGATGTFKPWGANIARYAFYGVVPFADGRDSAYLVGGSTDWGRGMVARLDGESMTIVAEEMGVRTLYAAAEVPDNSFIAVGARGSIARLRGGAVIETATACDNDLHAVGLMGSEIFVAGSGAWIFRVKTGSLAIEIEPVETTSNLTCLATHPDGQAWVGSDRGRILRRRDGIWRRMTHPFAGDPAVLAVQATPTNMRAVLADGTVLLGQPR